MKTSRARMTLNLATLTLFAVCSSVALSSSFAHSSHRTHDHEPSSMSSSRHSYVQRAKTNCNCSLAVASTTRDVFQTDAVAVSFIVHVDKSINTTTDEEDFSFVWVHKTRAKFLLALPDDSEILSLTTLQHSVYVLLIRMSPINDSKCFNTLTSLCQAEVIVAAFYSNSVFHVPNGKPFCFPPLEPKNQSKDDNIVHRCCSLNKDTDFVNCTETINPNIWVAYAIVAVQFGSAIMFVLSPLLFKYLPARDNQIARKSRNTAPRSFGYSSIPVMSVDSTIPNRKLLTLLEPLSFVTCGGDEGKGCYSRLGRALVLFIFPSIFCVYVILFFLNNHAAKIRTNVSYYTGLVAFLKPPIEYYLFAIVFFCIFLLGVLVLIPGRLSGIGKALSGRRDERTFLSFEKPAQFVNHHSGKVGFQFLHKNMVFHLKCCFDLAFWLFILKVIFSPCTRLCKSCCCAAPPVDGQTESSPNPGNNDALPILCNVLGFIFLPVIMVLWTAFVLLTLFVYVTPVGYVAFRIFRYLYSKDIPVNSVCCETLPSFVRFISVVFLYLFFILFCICVLCSYILVTSMFGVFVYILCKVFLYTLIGFGFNVEFYIPYAVAGTFVFFYIWRAFNHYLSVYENLRTVLFEECEKYEQQASSNGKPDSPNQSDLSPQSSGTGFLLFLDYNNNPSVPLNLYVATYRRLRPCGKTFFTILTKLLLTFLYLSVAFSSIMSLDKTEDTSTYVQAVFLFATFALPLVLCGGGSSYSKRRRKELEYQVRFIIHKYVSKVATSSEMQAGGSVDLPITSEIFEI